MGLRRSFVRKVERLRVILSGELEYFLAGHLVSPEIGLGADDQIFEIEHGIGA